MGLNTEKIYDVPDYNAAKQRCAGVIPFFNLIRLLRIVTNLRNPTEGKLKELELIDIVK